MNEEIEKLKRCIAFLQREIECLNYQILRNGLTEYHGLCEVPEEDQKAHAEILKSIGYTSFDYFKLDEILKQNKRF